MHPPSEQLGKPLLLGADLSALASMEGKGGIFRDDDKPGDAIAIFAANGWNCFRSRLFLQPDGRGGVVNDLTYTRALARRFKAAGAVFILDIHYSDTWADPQHQIKPNRWAHLPFDALAAAVRVYTCDVIRDLQAHGAAPDIVQIGNEITGGLLWPDAQVKVPVSTIKVYGGEVQVISPPEPYDDAAQWKRLAAILQAGIAGARDARGQAIQVMLHIDCGGDWPLTRWFFDRLAQHGVDYDLIGQSYYPNWHGTLSDLTDNLERTAEQFHRDIVIVETAYPHRNANEWASRKNMSWPVTREGQCQFLRDLIQTVRSAPRGRGVIYWHPESITLPDQPSWQGGDWALFDDRGNALPAMHLLSSFE